MDILICDDMNYETVALSGLVADSGFDVNITAFNSAHDALAHFRDGAKFDVCFLDILMPDMDGIELAEALRESGYLGFIVFLTGSKSYAPESYRVKAFDYLIKPASADRVKEVLTELDIAQKTADNGGMLVKSSGMSRMVLFREISHIEVIHNIVHIMLTDGSVQKTRTTLSEIAARLFVDARFIQCHRSFIVNMDFIAALDGNSFIMRDSTDVPISRNHTDIKEKYIKTIQTKK